MAEKITLSTDCRLKVQGILDKFFFPEKNYFKEIVMSNLGSNIM